ncbi:hypothetical protein GCM10027168_15060 [Streptomyces capparidis]
MGTAGPARRAAGTGGRWGRARSAVPPARRPAVPRELAELGPLPWLDGDGLPGEPGPVGPFRVADDVRRQIKGFVSRSAVAPGETLDFRVTVDPPQEFRIDVYRMGHYGGAGARHVTAGPWLPGMTQPPPLVAGRTVSCHHWWRSWRLRVPPSWCPGAYVAVLTRADGHLNHIPFTVRELPAAPREEAVPRPAELLLVLPDLTWQARNTFPEDGRTGAALCRSWPEAARPPQDGRPPERQGPFTVSFDRPYAGSGLPPLAAHVYDVVRWADRFGYELAYAEARDLHAGLVDPARYRGVVFPGHDEYWTVPMRRAVERARDRGTSLVFLSAGALYWQAELAPSPSGEPDRLLSCHRRRGDRRGRGALWREAGEPEQLLLGIQHAGPVPEPAPLVVRNADHWLWKATGAGEGDLLPGLVGGEADRYFPRTGLPTYTTRILLAHSPYRDGRGTRRHQETSLYRAPSGAFVFASGTRLWSPALDRPGRADPRVQRATANLLDRVCTGERPIR